MTEQQLKEKAEAHARSVLAMDLEAIMSDLVEALHPHVEAIAATLPEGLSDAEVESVSVADGHGRSVTAYRGTSVTLRMDSRWEDRGQGLQITESAPVG